ncbi:tetraspanin-6 isoform X2 [Oryza brachyantha]|uniref:tetraspanin-6 isoform X2 n=1 Tax=Oryza brachyantha TaxID=4533 RepID=UPI0007769651|nr:tetraspanin-6 isoform X2 [Oryza brachyantha]
MYPYRFSNVMIGYLNLATLLASIPVIGAGLWMAKGSTATCSSMLQTPLLVIGFVVLLVSLAGFVGACFHVAWALWLYLLAMMLLIAFLLGLTAFGFAVTAGGGGTQVPGRPYREYHTSDYSSWLQKHIQDAKYWRPALACVVGSKACPKIASWTPMDYLQHDLTPIQVHTHTHKKKDNLFRLDESNQRTQSILDCWLDAVGVLQAADGVRVQRRGGGGGAGGGLLPVEQRGGDTVLRVRVVQGRGDGEGEGGLAQGVGAERDGAGGAGVHLRLRLLRLPQRPPLRLRVPIRGKPHAQDPPALGLLLVAMVA